MSQLPTGTVTFVFTDIEGSTSMLQRLGEPAYLGVLETHNEIIRAAFSAGTEVRTEGDSFFYAFASAADAVSAASEGQRALAGHVWPNGGEVRVRMGMHTGEGTLGAADYISLDVNRAARIAEAGHGGQVLVSAATKTVSGDTPMEDLGAHRFKDIVDPEQVYQLTLDATVAGFPPIRSLNTPRSNLPSQQYAFIGRERESAELTDLVQRTPLVTITGPGGAGKTRMAIHVASQVPARFPDGVMYVALDALRESSLVAPAVADVLGLEGDPNRSAADVITSHLIGKTILLILDNFEHVVEASDVVATLLRSLPNLRILVTSQALLAIHGEIAYLLPPLSELDSVEFFIDRARSYDSTLTFEESDRSMIETLVNRLERMPLALELAAARVRLFGLEGLIGRVAHQLDVGIGPSDLPDRQRTLDAAIRWSHELLDDHEKHVLRHLGVFDGGFTLDAAEAVVGSNVLAALASLIDKSLIRSTVIKGEARFSLLDSIRRFAIDELSDDERVSVANAHGEYFAQLGEGARPEFESEKQALWLERFTAEHENLRAVVRWGLKTNQPDAGLRAVGAAWRFFHRRGHMPEARDRLRQLLALEGASAEARTEGLNGLAGILYWQGEYESALHLYEELLERFTQLHDLERIADTLFALSTTHAFLGDYATGSELSARARAAYDEAGIVDGVRRVYAIEAFVAWQTGRLEDALPLWQKAQRMYERAGDTAERLQIEIGIAAITHQLGRTSDAVKQAGNILNALREIDDISGTITLLDFLSTITVAVDPEPAVRLAGAANRLRDELGSGLRPEAVGLASAREVAEATMPDDLVEDAWEHGRRMRFEDAVALAQDLISTHA